MEQFDDNKIHGFIKVQREMQNSALWSLGIDYIGLMVVLYMEAAYKDHYSAGEYVKRGQFITGLNKMAEKTGETRERVRYMLAKLEKMGVIKQSSTHRNTTITICDYSDSQDNKVDLNTVTTQSEHSNNTVTTQSEHSRTTTQEDTSSDKQYKNGKRKSASPRGELLPLQNIRKW